MTIPLGNERVDAAPTVSSVSNHKEFANEKDSAFVGSPNNNNNNNNLESTLTEEEISNYKPSSQFTKILIYFAMGVCWGLLVVAVQTFADDTPWVMFLAVVLFFIFTVWLIRRLRGVLLS